MFTKDRLRDPALLRFPGFIAGEWRDSDAGGSLAVTDPATGETIGTVPDCGADETRTAIAAAEAAFSGLAPYLAGRARRDPGALETP